MNSITTLTMTDGVRIVVPDSLDRITPYVLREQQDWFEDEIRFARRLLMPGDKVIILSTALVDEAAIPSHSPSVIFVDAKNGIAPKSA